MGGTSTTPWSPDVFVARLREEGARRYHDKHPFHVRMHAGGLSREELAAWVANRYYYQTRVPIKDAIILSKSEDPAFRRRWMARIEAQDGRAAGDGGLAQWERLAEGVGIDVDALRSLSLVLPGVRFACDAYVALVRTRSLIEAVASSLTEFFAPELMARRIVAWEAHYPWVSPETLAYFRVRVERARIDSNEAIDFVITRATTREVQERCVDALVRKTEILWAMLDAIEHAGSREAS
jgi:pyrroloquinoline-quinone synthase